MGTTCWTESNALALGFSTSRTDSVSKVYLRRGQSSAGDCWKRLDVHKEDVQHLNMTGDLSQLVVFGVNEFQYLSLRRSKGQLMFVKQQKLLLRTMVRRNSATS